METSRLSLALILWLPLLTSVPATYGVHRDASPKVQTQGGGTGKRRETAADNDISHEDNEMPVFSVQYLPEKTDFDLAMGPLASQVLVTQPPHIHIQPSRVLPDNPKSVTSIKVIRPTASRVGLATSMPAVMDASEGTSSASYTAATWQASSSLSPTDSTPPLQPLAGLRPTSTAAPAPLQEGDSPWGQRTLVIVTGQTVPAQGTASRVSVNVARLTVATSPPMKHSMENEVK